MRILHTSDWHLGHTLGGLSRRLEHQRFFEWLRDLCVDHQVDALLVTGDIFDSANPPASAFEDFYGLLADLRAAVPDLEVVVIGGNHDSPTRLEAPHPLLKSLRITVLGSLPRLETNSSGQMPIDVQRVVVPLHDRDGLVRAWCVAIPYLRPADLATRWLAPSMADNVQDPLVEGVREVYTDAVEYAKGIREPGQAIIATGHCYMAHGKLSELSERKILGGNLHALPADLVSEDVSYLALGHLHLAQIVGNNSTRRYSGAPIPLHVDESHYPHQVVLVEFSGEHVQTVTSVRVPRAIEFLRVPETGVGSPDDVLAKLRELPNDTGDIPPPQWPYLDIRVRLTDPMPDLRTKIETELANKVCRLVKITVETPGTYAALSDTIANASLTELDPEFVFMKLHESRYGGPPKSLMLKTFRDIVNRIAEQGRPV
ncbi:MAG: exonuclease SbcCD subunit D C-terminal domain-containing protein [Myxococcales bacterium]|nr:exonuclease SbcCD subunit D C-terminal domain-containing protein [Myxococcales bacterium]